jgi:hypothetical protein
VLIGEPGLGKTTALKQASEALHKNSDSDDEVLFIDLSATTEGAVLRSRIFDSPQWRRWDDGNHRLHLFLDTLDFALLGWRQATRTVAVDPLHAVLRPHRARGRGVSIGDPLE